MMGGFPPFGPNQDPQVSRSIWTACTGACRRLASWPWFTSNVADGYVIKGWGEQAVDEGPFGERIPTTPDVARPLPGLTAVSALPAECEVTRAAGNSRDGTRGAPVAAHPSNVVQDESAGIGAETWRGSGRGATIMANATTRASRMKTTPIRTMTRVGGRSPRRLCLATHRRRSPWLQSYAPVVGLLPSAGPGNLWPRNIVPRQPTAQLESRSLV
jgi:hypothetical protein